MYLSFFGIALQFVLIWSLYTNEAGQYRILSPQKMETQYKILKTTSGEVYTYTSFTEWSPSDSQNGFFMINYYDLMKGQFVHGNDALANELMMTISDEIKNVFSGEIIYENDISKKGVYGRLLRIEYNNGQSVMKSKIFIKNKRVYVLQVLTDKTWALDESVDKFLDSFEIIN